MNSKKTKYHHGDLKKALLQAALHQIEETDSVDFSLRELSNKLGVSHTAAYRHFVNKEALLFAIAEEGFEQLAQSFDQAGARTDNSLPALLQKGSAYIDFACKHPAHFKVMFFGAVENIPPTPRFLEVSQRAFKSLQDSIKICAEQNLLREDINIDQAALACWAMMHGIVTLYLAKQLPGPTSFAHLTPSQWGQTVGEALFKGLLTP